MCSIMKYLQEWTDSNMRWNVSEYNNVKDIRVPPATLWKPDILMYNRYNKEKEFWSIAMNEFS